MRRLNLVLLCHFMILCCNGQSEKLTITPLTSHFFIYTTYNNYQDTKIPANGMYLVTEKGAILFDTPWDSTQFQPLLDSIKARHHKNVVMAFATHWHSDKTAGLEYYRQQGIKTFTTVQTDELCKSNGKKRAEFLMSKDTVFQFGGYRFQTYYPGPAHTADNIVIWFPAQRILYSGCLIKGAKDEDLGFLGDGDKKNYLSALMKVQKKFPDPRFITVAHSDWHDLNSLKHSIEMARRLQD